MITRADIIAAREGAEMLSKQADYMDTIKGWFSDPASSAQAKDIQNKINQWSKPNIQNAYREYITKENLPDDDQSKLKFFKDAREKLASKGGLIDQLSQLKQDSAEKAVLDRYSGASGVAGLIVGGLAGALFGGKKGAIIGSLLGLTLGFFGKKYGWFGKDYDAAVKNVVNKYGGEAGLTPEERAGMMDPILKGIEQYTPPATPATPPTAAPAEGPAPTTGTGADEFVDTAAPAEEAVPAAATMGEEIAAQSPAADTQWGAGEVPMSPVGGPSTYAPTQEELDRDAREEFANRYGDLFTEDPVSGATEEQVTDFARRQGIPSDVSKGLYSDLVDTPENLKREGDAVAESVNRKGWYHWGLKTPEQIAALKLLYPGSKHPTTSREAWQMSMRPPADFAQNWRVTSAGLSIARENLKKAQDAIKYYEENPSAAVPEAMEAAKTRLASAQGNYDTYNERMALLNRQRDAARAMRSSSHQKLQSEKLAEWRELNKKKAEAVKRYSSIGADAPELVRRRAKKERDRFVTGAEGSRLKELEDIQKQQQSIFADSPWEEAKLNKPSDES